MHTRTQSQTPVTLCTNKIWFYNFTTICSNSRDCREAHQALPQSFYAPGLGFHFITLLTSHMYIVCHAQTAIIFILPFCSTRQASRGVKVKLCSFALHPFYSSCSFLVFLLEYFFYMLIAIFAALRWYCKYISSFKCTHISTRLTCFTDCITCGAKSSGAYSSTTICTLYTHSGTADDCAARDASLTTM